MSADGYDSMDAQEERLHRRRLLTARLGMVRKIHTNTGGFCTGCPVPVGSTEEPEPYPCSEFRAAEDDIRNEYAGLPLDASRLQAIQALLDADAAHPAEFLLAEASKLDEDGILDLPEIKMSRVGSTRPGIVAAGGWCAPSVSLYPQPRTPEQIVEDQRRTIADYQRKVHELKLQRKADRKLIKELSRRLAER